jgi:hypothetical protein
MQYDFSTVEDVQSFVSVPEGTYLCRIAEVRERTTREGAPLWSFRLEVAEGDYAGRTGAWDSLSWSERGLSRVKQVLARLGFDVSGMVNITPDDLLDLQVQAELVIEEREDPVSGRRVERMRVPYMGYEAVEEGEATAV